MEAKRVAYSASESISFPTPGMFNNTASLHGGELFKMIDDIGGVAAMRHAETDVVTASVGWLKFVSPVVQGEFVIMKSSVQAVGRSSLEVGVRVEAEDVLKKEKRHVATCYLTYVAVDKAGRSKEVPPLILETEIERERNRQAEERKRLRAGK